MRTLKEQIQTEKRAEDQLYGMSRKKSVKKGFEKDHSEKRKTKTNYTRRKERDSRKKKVQYITVS